MSNKTLNSQDTKRILCNNILNNKECSYGSKCLYAHGLSDQQIYPIRKKVYDILRSDSNLSSINLTKDKELFNALLELKKVCVFCQKNVCPGGYNCKNGSLSIRYRVCYDDIMFGNCKKYNCNGVHLTKRGLISYYTQLNGSLPANRWDNTNTNTNISNTNISSTNTNTNISNTNTNIIKPVISKPINITNNQFNLIDSDEDSIDENYTEGNDILGILDNNSKSYKQFKEMLNIKDSNNGVLLTERFLLDNFKKSNEDRFSESDDSIENIEEMINYINNGLDNDPYDESIFSI